MFEKNYILIIVSLTQDVSLMCFFNFNDLIRP
jgi:hypothetical protein